MTEWLDETVGDDRWPDVPEYDWGLYFAQYYRRWGKATRAVQVVVTANVSGITQAFTAIHQQMEKLGIAVTKTPKQSDFTLCPPLAPAPVKIKHWTLLTDQRIQRLDNEAIQMQATHRALRLSRPIGQQGCGFVWNRGRVGT